MHLFLYKINIIEKNKIFQNPQPSTSGGGGMSSDDGAGTSRLARPLETLSEGHTDEEPGPSPRASIPNGEK